MHMCVRGGSTGQDRLMIFFFSECVTEKDISYYGNDVNNGLENVQSDTESCRASCKAMGAPYFDFNYAGNRGCYCKNSNAGRRKVAGVMSGETCHNLGEY